MARPIVLSESPVTAGRSARRYVRGSGGGGTGDEPAPTGGALTRTGVRVRWLLVTDVNSMRVEREHPGITPPGCFASLDTLRLGHDGRAAGQMLDVRAVVARVRACDPSDC